MRYTAGVSPPRERARDLREFYIPRHDQDDPSFTRVRLTKVSSPAGGNPAAFPRTLGPASNFRQELAPFSLLPFLPLLLGAACASSRARARASTLKRTSASTAPRRGSPYDQQEEEAGRNVIACITVSPARESNAPPRTGEYENPAKQHGAPCGFLRRAEAARATEFHEDRRTATMNISPGPRIIIRNEIAPESLIERPCAADAAGPGSKHELCCGLRRRRLRFFAPRIIARVVRQVALRESHLAASCARRITCGLGNATRILMIASFGGERGDDENRLGDYASSVRGICEYIV